MDMATLSMRLNGLGMEELRSLNSAVVDRIRFLQRQNAAGSMSKFHIGQMVQFAKGHRMIQMKITKFNQKTVNGNEVVAGVEMPYRPWRVTASLLHEVK